MRINKNCFIRNEVDKGNGEDVLLIFIPESNEMFEASKEFCEVIELIDNGKDKEDIVDEINKKYTGSTKEEISSAVDNMMEEMLKIGVLINE